jgi:16S rRNA (guanine1207-N2)-methyltransferase
VAASQYFERTPGVPSKPSPVVLALADLTLRLGTDRGVFSYGGGDAGTRLLLQEAAPPPPAGDLLDLGCGYGPIALTLASRAPASTVWAVDTNERALSLCAANAEANGIHNVRPVAVREVPPDLRFAAIWSNPPIRIGKAALHDLLLTWLARLTGDGVATLVVQKHLGADSLAAWLTGEGWMVERVASRQGYRLLTVRARA